LGGKGSKTERGRLARMWAEAYESFFTYFPLYQYDKAFSQSSALEKEARQHGETDLELFALQIQGYAYTERNAKDTEKTASKKLISAQSIFDRALRLANQHGLEYEGAWISNAKALTFFYGGEAEKALGGFEHAEELAQKLSDQSLLTQAQKNIVTTHVEFGDFSGAIDTYTRISESIPEGKNQLRVSLIHEDIAKIHARLYEFRQAIEGYSSVLEFFENVEDQESTGRVLVSLASAYIEIGKLSHATELLDRAFQELDAANYGRGKFDAHKLQANISRQLGKFEEMNQHRSEQFKYLVSDHERALASFESAKDFYMQGRLNDSRQFFIQSTELAQATNHEYLKTLPKLYLCLIGYQLETSAHQCLGAAQGSIYAEVQSLKNIRRKFEGLFLWAQIQLKAGRQNEAFAVLDDLVNDIRFYRNTLPGVLGAWFWENNRKIFETYLKIAADNHSEPSASAIKSLKAIQKIKSITRVKNRIVESDQTTQRDLEAAAAIRMLIAKMESGKFQLSNLELGTQLDKLILGTSNHLAGLDQEADDGWLSDALKNLPEDSALLTIYIFDNETYVWVANKSGVILKRFEQSFDVGLALEKVIKNSRYQGSATIQLELENLGRALLKPVMEHLPENIFFLPLGKFNGFPLDALRIDGQYLIEQHQVINIGSLDSLKSISDDKFLQVSTEQIFFAGNQFFHDAEMMDLPGISTESADIEKIFNKSAIYFATGGKLSADSFLGPEIRKANIIHIASHAVLDVNYPELSRIYLNPDAANSHSPSESILIPADIMAGRYSADLVVLSACQTSGFNRFSFDSNLGFVSQFIASGAHAAIASLWPIPDSDSALLLREFYSTLNQEGNAATSLASAKRKYIRSNVSNRVDVWAAFQLFL